MAIKYEIQQIENASGTGEPRKFVRLHQGKAMTADELAERVEQSCSATRSDILAVMAEIHHVAVQELNQGNRFYLPEIGYLSLSVGNVPLSKKVDGKITGKDIYLKNLDFKPEAKFLKEVRKGMSFEKSAYTTSSVQYTEEELWHKTETYLSDHRYVTLMDLCSLFGLSKYKAAQWLATFVEKGLLTKEGTARHPLYFLNE